MLHAVELPGTNKRSELRNISSHLSLNSIYSPAGVTHLDTGLANVDGNAANKIKSVTVCDMMWCDVIITILSSWFVVLSKDLRRLETVGRPTGERRVNRSERRDLVQD